MFHRCQSASTPALGIQVCLNPVEFSARTAEIRWQCKMIADVVGNGLFDTIVLCHVFPRTLSKTVTQFDSVDKFDISFGSNHEEYFLQ